MMSWLDLWTSSSATATRDALVAPCWLLVNVLTCAAAWKWARRLFPHDSYLELIGHTVVLCWAGIVVAGTMLGAVGLLSGLALLLAVAAEALAGLAALRLCAGAAPAAPVPWDRAEAWWLGLWTLLVGYWAGHVITAGLLKFPTDWDSLAYHIPLVNHWLQTGSLATAHCARWANPGNNELLALWAVAPFSGDFLVSLNNLPAALLFACGSVAFATQLGIRRPLAHLGGFALVSNYVVLKQLVDAENDVAVAAGFFAALAYSFRSVRAPGVAPLLLGSLCLGLLAGVKYYAVGYAALALAGWVFWTAWRRGPRAAAQVLLAGVAGVVALAGYWYLRNYGATGSPLYPRDFFKSPDVLAHIYPDVVHTSFFGNRRPELLELYLQAIWRLTGPWQLAGFLLAPVSLVWLLGTALRRRAAAEARLALALLLGGTGFLLGNTPFAVEDNPGTLNQMHWHYCPVRYGLCFLSISTLAALLLLQDLFFTAREPAAGKTGVPRRPWRRSVSTALTYLGLASAIFFQLAWPAQRLPVDRLNNLLIAANLVLLGLSLVMLQEMWPKWRRWLVLLLVTALPCWAWACAGLSEHWHNGFVPHYDRMLIGGGLKRLDEQATETQRICVLQQRYYPFFGSRRQHRVYQPVYVPSPAWLMDLLRDESFTVIVAKVQMPTTGWRRFLGFDECREQHPNRFRLVSHAPGYAIFAVLPWSRPTEQTTEIPTPSRGPDAARRE